MKEKDIDIDVDMLKSSTGILIDNM